MASIRKRGDKWQARVRIKGLQPIEKSFPTRADAEAWSKITEAEIIRGTFIRRTDSERTTLREALNRYATEITPTKRGAATELIRVAMWQKHQLANRALATLRGADFSKYRDNRLKEGRAPATVRLELALIGNLFNIARREWGFDGLQNPVEAIRLPSVSNARNRTFLDDEEKWLFAALELAIRSTGGLFGVGTANQWIRPIVSIALETAMRRGELLALRWENVRLADRVATLPNTKNGLPRSVPLSSKAIEVLKQLPRALHGPVFPITSNALKLSFTRTVKRARQLYENAGGTDPRMLVDLHFHDLRHIAVSRLAQKLPNVIELAAVSGHKDVRMLSRYYHVSAKELAAKIG